MNIKKGICSIATMSVMIILAVALSVTTKLVQQKQNNVVDAASPIITSDSNKTIEGGYYKYQLLDGDVSGDNEGVPDGKIDSRDYSYAKERGTEAQVKLIKQSLTNNQTY